MKKLLVLLAFCGSAHAEFYSGNELWQRLNSESVVERSISMGFVAGVSDAITNILTCPPDYSTVGQAKDIVYRWIAENPQHRHFSASSLVVAALSSAWPCKKGQKL